MQDILIIDVLRYWETMIECMWVPKNNGNAFWYSKTLLNWIELLIVRQISEILFHIFFENNVFLNRLAVYDKYYNIRLICNERILFEKIFPWIQIFP